MPEPEGQQLDLPNLPPARKPATASGLFTATKELITSLRAKFGSKPDTSLKEIIEEALEEEAGNEVSISNEEKDLLKNVIRFSELTARDVMVPRTEIEALSSDVTFEALKNHAAALGHTRIPVYEDSLDKIEGFIHVKDLFRYITGSEPFQLRRILHEILFVPPSMRIVDLLLKMRVSGCHMAIVVDEYGGTSGLVTMEDLFEELVGEIQDEHDEEHEVIVLRWIGEVLEADARALIEEVEAMLGEKLHSEGVEPADYDTLGGFIFYTLGRVPVRGEILKIRERLKIEIIAADPRRVRQVRISRLASPLAVTDAAA